VLCWDNFDARNPQPVSPENGAHSTTAKKRNTSCKERGPSETPRDPPEPDLIDFDIPNLSQNRVDLASETYLKLKSPKCFRTYYLQCFVDFGPPNTVSEIDQKSMLRAF